MNLKSKQKNNKIKKLMAVENYDCVQSTRNNDAKCLNCVCVRVVCVCAREREKIKFSV